MGMGMARWRVDTTVTDALVETDLLIVAAGPAGASLACFGVIMVSLFCFGCLGTFPPQSFLVLDLLWTDEMMFGGTRDLFLSNTFQCIINDDV